MNKTPFAILCPLLAVGLHAQEFSPEVVDRIEKATGRVVTNTNGGQVGTAFLYSAGNLAVTCLHVVGGATEIEVTFPGGTCTGVIKKTSKKNDLALLELRGDAEAHPLPGRVLGRRERPPLKAHGSRYGNARMTSSNVSLRDIGARRLEDLLPDRDEADQALRRQIARAGCPELTAEILDLEASLVGGISGGPIFDREGKVVGVCNGGLERGATETSWGIPGSALEELLESDEDPLAASRAIPRSGVSFSVATREISTREPVEVAGRRFLKIRTKTLRELVRYTDDALGLAQLTNEFRGFEPDNWEFDVYRDLENGATLVVPKGKRLTTEGGFIVVTLQPALKMYAATGPVPIAMVNQRTVAFEQTLMANNVGIGWQMNPQWSQLGPVTYTSGLMVRRLSHLGCSAALDSWGRPMFFPNGAPQTILRGYMMITHASYMGSLFSVAARRDDVSTYGRGDELDRDWGKAVLSVHLSTFPGNDEVE